MSVELIIGRRAVLNDGLYEALCEYRHDVFIRKMGWELTGRRTGQEEDEFDTSDALYIVCRDIDGRICGSARLLPTTRPYLLGNVFSHLAAEPLASSPAVWELSRFSSTSTRDARDLARMLFLRALDVAGQEGATRVVGVMSLAMERLCRSFGVQIDRMGVPQRHRAATIVACSVSLPLLGTMTSATARLRRTFSGSHRLPLGMVTTAVTARSLRPVMTRQGAA